MENINAKEFNTMLREMNACNTALEWAAEKDFKTVWLTCERGDWMLWLVKKMENKNGWPDLRQQIAAKVKCARLVQHLMKDERSTHALDVAERFSIGNATIKEMNAAAAAAYAAVGDAAVAAAAAAMRKDTLKKCADICREVFTIQFDENI